jgi:hypothetical protein
MSRLREVWERGSFYRNLAIIPGVPLAVAAGVVLLGDRLTERHAEQKPLHPQLQHETVMKPEVPNGGVCEGDIFTIGELKVRIPKTELFQSSAMPKEKPAK